MKKCRMLFTSLTEISRSVAIAMMAAPAPIATRCMPLAKSHRYQDVDFTHDGKISLSNFQLIYCLIQTFTQ